MSKIVTYITRYFHNGVHSRSVIIPITDREIIAWCGRSWHELSDQEKDEVRYYFR